MSLSFNPYVDVRLAELHQAELVRSSERDRLLAEARALSPAEPLRLRLGRLIVRVGQVVAGPQPPARWPQPAPTAPLPTPLTRTA